MDKEATVFKTLSDPTRLRLMVLLANCDEICVCRLTEALQVPQSSVSRHLAVMRYAGLVEARREGTWMYYKLAEPVDELHECLLACFRDCFQGHKAAREDISRLLSAGCSKT